MTTSVWKNPSSGLWSTPANWSNGVPPDNIDDVATFSPLSALPGIYSINLNGSETVGTVNLSSNATAHYLLGGGTLITQISSVTRGASADVIVSGTGYGATFGSTLAWQLASATTATIGPNLVLDVQGKVSGNKRLSKDGVGKLILANTGNDWTGGLSITDGTVAAGDYFVFNTNDIFVGATGVLDVNGLTQGLGAISGTGTITNSNANTSIGLYTPSATTFAGTIEDGYQATLSVTKTGFGALTLSGFNTYSGDTHLNAGSIVLGSDHGLSIDSRLTIMSGATLDMNGHLGYVAGLAGAGSIVNTPGTYALLDVTEAGSEVFSGEISGTNLHLQKYGAGVLTLSGANAFSGWTTIQEGTLATDAAQVLASSTRLNVMAGATFDLHGYAQTANGPLSGAGVITSNASAAGASKLTIVETSDSTFDGVISDGANDLVSLEKKGAGKLTLTGTSTYHGATTISQGTLALSGNAAAFYNSPTTIAAGATLDLTAKPNWGTGVKDLVNNGTILLGLNSGFSASQLTSDLTGTIVSSGDNIFTISLDAATQNFTDAGATFSNWDDAADWINIYGNALGNSLVGSWHAEHFSGGAGDDTIFGGAGGDSIAGGGGVDTAVYSVAKATATITRTIGRSQGLRISTSLDGVDQVNAEWAQFSDGRVYIGKSAHDFGFDGCSDVLFRNASGVTYLWSMNGANVAGGATTSVQVGTNWRIRGVGDFDGDYAADLLWEYNNTGSPSDPLNGVTYISFQNGASTISDGLVQQLSGNWQIQCVADLTGDGRADILYRDSLTGNAYLDGMDGLAIPASWTGFTTQQVTDPNWRIVAAADFDADGMADILWRYNNAANAADTLNGALYEWKMAGKNVDGANVLTQQAPINWAVAGTGDFNGDGCADILFRYNNAANGSDPLNGMTYIDFVNGTNVLASSNVTQWQVDNSWTLASIGDFNGDSKSDIVWQQASTGNMYLWTMNGTAVTAGSTTSAQPGLGWTVQNGATIAG